MTHLHKDVFSDNSQHNACNVFLGGKVKQWVRHDLRFYLQLLSNTHLQPLSLPHWSARKTHKAPYWITES